MQPIDLSLRNVPVFIPDVDSWTQPICDFINVDELQIFSCISFSVLMLNIRSCRKNFNQFLANFCNVLTYFSCILLTETWLTAEVDNAFNIPGFYCFNLYRNRFGGGIKMYLKNSIQARLLENFTFINDLFEILTVEVMLGRNKAVLSTLYHPPTSSIEGNNAFIESLSSHLRLLVNMKVPLILAGDFNINLLNPNNLIYVNTFVHSMLEFGLTPLITLPTKVNLENHITRFSILDHIWVSECIVNLRSFIFPLNITDHFPVGALLKFPFNFNFSKQRYQCRTLCGRGRHTFSLLFSNINVQMIQGNYNLTFNNYVADVFRCYNTAFPIKLRLENAKHPAPWMTPRLKQCVQKKSKLYKLYLKGRIVKGQYIFYRNQLTALIRRVKRLYYSKALYYAACDSKKTWSCLNSIMERSTCSTLKELKVGNIVLTGQNLVNYINNYFITSVNAITASLTPAPSYRFFSTPVLASCFFYPTTQFEVSKVIGGLRNKGNRLLDIHPSVVKENVNVFSHHMAILYNLSLTESIFPDISKIGRVNPVHKSGPTDCIDNYRPISVLPIFSKVFEKLTLKRIVSFITRFAILSPCQFGFRSGRSTTQAITKLLSSILQAYHSKIYCACFFLDLRKAFDTIDHRILMEKLMHYGFRGSSNDYLKSYYHNRSQYVYLNGYESDVMPITNGVPQGSILGPLCFSLFINDLPLAVDADTVLFADDAAFVIKSSSLADLYLKINKLFTDIASYLNNNRLIANSSKSKLMMFSSRPTQDLPGLLFANSIVEWVDEFKYLGLTITNKLSYAKHIDRVSLNVSRVTGIFTNLRSLVPLYVLFKLFYALAYPHLINHIVIWGSAPASHLKVLTTRMNNMLRVILGVKWTDGRPNLNTDVMYRRNDVMKVESIYRYCLFKLLKKLLDGGCPEMFGYLLEPHLSLRNYETRNGIFRHPALACEVERRSLPHQLIKLYDSIPADLLNQSFNLSVKNFKRYLLNDQ